MNLKQVLSIEQMNHLQELDLDKSDASMHWQFLPIPSFDQILEANKDVLQRMKEKGETK